MIGNFLVKEKEEHTGDHGMGLYETLWRLTNCSTKCFLTEKISVVKREEGNRLNC